MTLSFPTIRFFGLLLALCLPMTIYSLEPVNVRSMYYLVSSAVTNISPFAIQTDARDSESALLRLQVSCSEDVLAGVYFLPTNSSPCLSPNMTGTVQDLNARLASLKASSADISKTNLQISYQLFDGADAHIFSVSQTFSALKRIPANLLSNKIKLDVTSEGSSARVAVLTVDHNYQASFGLETIFVTGTEGLGVTFRFEDNILYMTPSQNGLKKLADKLPADVSFSLVDSSTRLTSDTLHVYVTDSSAKKSGSKLVFVAILGAFVAAATLCFLFCVVSSRRKAQAVNIGNSIDAKQLASLPTDHNQTEAQDKTVVLTESIVTWNKKLLEKHKKKHVSDPNEDTNIVILGRDRQRKQEVPSAERLPKGEEFPKEDSRRYRPFDDISVINTESLELKSPSDGRGDSSFLEDFNL